MQRRRFVLGAASAALTTPLLGVSGCGSSNNDAPVPVPASEAAIHLPADHYMHRGAPTEWWWNTGTLKAGERLFGFEINAAAFTDQGLGFTQISLTDVANNKHYQRTTPYLPPLAFDPENWAEHDVVKDWSVALGSVSNHLSAIEVVSPGSGYTSDPTISITGGGGTLALAVPIRVGDKIANIALLSPGVGFTSVPTVTISGGGGSGATARAFHSYVTMNAAWGDPTKSMAVKARLVDEATGSVVLFDLMLSQQGRPFLVRGTGVTPEPGGTGTHLQKNNYYYSLTRLQASGSITIDGVRVDVTGVTWMDHEYGAFGKPGNPVKWILQDMQLDNGVHISNYAILASDLPPLNRKTESHATVQMPDGTLYYLATFTTPFGRTWTSPVSGKTYFLELQVEIPAFGAMLVVTSLTDAQEFSFAAAPVYEGIAAATGTFDGRQVSGPAWNEQALR